MAVEVSSPREEYQTKAEFCQEWNISERTADRWEALRIGPPRTLIGRQVYFHKPTVREWARRRQREFVR